jgi:microcystin-dependent protein
LQSVVAGSGIDVDDTDPANPVVSATGAVTSVNGESGDVTLTTDDISDSGQTNKWATAAEKTKLGHITVTQAVDLDTMESDIAGKQPLDSDLTAIAGLSPSNDDFLQRKSGAWTNRTPAQAVTDLKAALVDLLYPVGCIKITISSTNPGTYLGGTWSAFGSGRVPVGYDSGQTEFDTDEETGGAKTHTLTTAEMPSHTHVQDAHTHTQNSHNHTQDAHAHTVSGIRGNIGWSGGGSRALDPDVGGAQGTSSVTATNQAATATNQNTTATNQNTGGGGAHNNLQPYIVVRMWKRTA